MNPSCGMNQKSTQACHMFFTVILFCSEGKKSLYIRLGCRGDWPDIKPPGWDPSTSLDASSPRS